MTGKLHLKLMRPGIYGWRAAVVRNPWVRLKQHIDYSMWYSKYAGQDIQVERVDSDGFWAREPSGHLNIIHFGHVERPAAQV